MVRPVSPICAMGRRIVMAKVKRKLVVSSGRKRGKAKMKMEEMR